MTCLNDSHIQALADGEGSAEARRHALECADCAARVEARAALMASIVRSLDVPVALPDSFRLKAEATGNQKGATRLRESHGFSASDSRSVRLSPHSRSFRLQAE